MNNPSKQQSQTTRQLLLQHCKAHPEGQIQDVFKFLYQSAFGCEHLVSDQDAALRYILQELATLPPQKADPLEPLDGAYSRLPLSCLQEGLSPQTLAKIFCLSAKKESTGDADLQEKLRVARELVTEGALPFSQEAFDQAHDRWRQAGYPAIRHSEQFRKAYHPSYRVIANTYVKILPLLAKIDTLLCEKSNGVLAIEGGSASGKTTLAALLEEIYECSVLHMDDFFLRPEQRTPARFAEIGGNLDRERFLAEVLEPLHRGLPLLYRRFDCATREILPAVPISPKALTVIEGVYSMHPSLSPYYDLSVFLEISPTARRERILKRNTPTFAKRFFEEWIPLEQAYFAATNARERCDLTVSAD